MDNEKKREDIYFEQADVDNIIDKIINILNEEVTCPNIEQIKSHLKIIKSYQEKFISGTSSVSGFLGMSQIEELIDTFTREIKEANLKALLENMKSLKGENEIIAQKKTNTSKKTLS
ncbi:MAG: hypothetical protein LBE80_04650 [Deltaproteobacteria bacterium]|jgi:hypothetical protein|nr:hypothetical protein [Deltaproteobacteria bacterium]